LQLINIQACQFELIFICRDSQVDAAQLSQVFNPANLQGTVVELLAIYGVRISKFKYKEMSITLFYLTVGG